jgi:hypothetical protein
VAWRQREEKEKKSKDGSVAKDIVKFAIGLPKV